MAWRAPFSASLATEVDDPDLGDVPIPRLRRILVSTCSVSGEVESGCLRNATAGSFPRIGNADTGGIEGFQAWGMMLPRRCRRASKIWLSRDASVQCSRKQQATAEPSSHRDLRFEGQKRHPSTKLLDRHVLPPDPAGQGWASLMKVNVSCRQDPCAKNCPGSRNGEDSCKPVPSWPLHYARC